MRPVLYALAFFSMLSLGAKAPIWEDSGKEQKRKPAQSDLKLPSIDRYLDMSCFELTNELSADEFVRYFSRVAKSEYSDLCSLVKEDQDMDSDISQSERESIGLGTFSRLVEGHFDEFILSKRLTHYQDLSCETLQREETSDKFISFLREELKRDGGDLCKVGLGTKSKVVEVYFDAFLYRQ